MAYTNLMTIIYPVGSIYLSMSNVSPASLFGGSWEHLSTKRFLLMTNQASPGSTGGTPVHAHWMPFGVENFADGTGRFIARNGNMMNSNGYQARAYAGGNDKAWHNIYDRDAENRESNGTENTTSSESNMPPYYCCYGWRRLD